MEIQDSPLKDTFNITLLHQNVQSLGNSVPQIEVILSEMNNPYFLCLTEHWQCSEQLSVLQISEYTLVSSFCRGRGEHGGAAVYVRKDLKRGRARNDINKLSVSTKFECAAAEFCINNTNIIIVTIYRIPDNETTIFLNQISIMLDKLEKENKIIIISGDFNIHFERDCKQTKEFVNLLSSFNIQPSISEYTRTVQTSKSCVDNILFDTSKYKYSTKVIQSCISDHTAQLLCLDLNNRSSLNSHLKYCRIHSRKNVETFLSDLANISWHFVYESSDVNDVWNKFENVFTTCYNSNFPLRKKSTNKNNVNKLAWLTPEIKYLKEKVSTLQMLSNRSEQFKQVYKEYKDTYVNLLNETKQNYFAEKIDDSDNKSKTIWNIVNNLTNKTQDNLKTLPSNNKVKTMADNFNNHFANSAQNLILNSQISNSPYKCKIKKNPNSLYFYPTNDYEIITLCNKLKNKQSSGNDGIPTTILKKCIKVIAGPIAHIINLSMLTGTVPENLKLALILPIYKKGDINDYDNYRPINLLSAFSKLLELAVNTRLLNFFSMHSLFNQSQHGFLKNRSTETALIEITESIISALEAKDMTCGVFLDLSKAFDTLNHGILLQKLEAYGVRGVALDWFRSYLYNRQQKVIIQENGVNYYSKCLNVQAGIPQGSILGPILFVIYINDIYSVIAEPNAVINYADDCSVLIPVNKTQTIDEKCLRIIKDINLYLTENELVLNLDKSKCILFNTSSRFCPKINSLPIKKKEIQFVDSTKLLGVHIDENLNYSVHIQSLCTTLSKACYAIRVLVKYLNYNAVKIAYYGLVYSRIRYAILLWGGSTDLSKVFIWQKKIFRIMFHLKLTESCRGLFKRNGYLTVAGLYIFECILFLKKNRNEFVNDEFKHNFNTRNKNSIYRFENHRLTLTEKKPHYSAIKFFNHLPMEIKDTESYILFKNKLFNHICVLEPYSVNEYLDLATN